jgi:hypothetical protein
MAVRIMAGDLSELEIVTPVFRHFHDGFRLSAVLGGQSRVYRIIVNSALMNAHGEEREQDMRVRGKHPNWIRIFIKVGGASDVIYVKCSCEIHGAIEVENFVGGVVDRRVRNLSIFEPLTERNESIAFNAIIAVKQFDRVRVFRCFAEAVEVSNRGEIDCSLPVFPVVTDFEVRFYAGASMADAARLGSCRDCRIGKEASR